MKSVSLVLMSVVLAGLAFAQTAVVPAAIEGPISSIVATNANATVVVMGITILVTPDTVITTPTATLTLQQLLDTAPLPGRSEAGFVGGTAIVDGNTTEAGDVIADNLFVEPAENVVIGVVTENGAGSLKVNGMAVTMLTDERIPAEPLRNDLGFEIAREAITVGTVVALEGYYSASSQALQAFILEATGIPALNPGLQVSILRAQGRADRGELEVRGGVSGVPAGAVVTVQIRAPRANGTSRLLGTVTAVPDVLANTRIYRFRGQGITPFPANVFARVVLGGQTANSATTEVGL
jgi:hypothetical protein